MVILLALGTINAQISRTERQIIFLSSQNLFELAGQVTQSNFQSDSAVIYLYREQIQGTVELVDSIHSYNNQGRFSFRKMVSGTYYIRAKSLNTNNNFIDTYYGGSAVWINSKAIVLRRDMINRTIDLEKMNVFLGSAEISGKVEYGSGDINFPIGEEAKNIPVLILHNGSVIRRTVTDENGKYRFSNVPIMNYSLVVDYPGKSMVEHLISLNSSKNKVENQDFVLEKSTVRFKGGATGLVATQDKLLKVFPNPCRSKLNLKNADRFTGYKLLDYTGKERITGATIENEAIDISLMESGIYFLILEGSNAKEVVRITKE
tara:strand:- start:22087 stop:23043 length:957 start_codon:yes stop_codon:yes gene_type:complete